MDNGLEGRDLYFKRLYRTVANDGTLKSETGPVLCVRVWDAELFIAADLDRGAKPEKEQHGVVTYTPCAARREDYLQQQRNEKRYR